MGSDAVNHPFLSLPEGWGVGRLEDHTVKVGSGATPRGGKDAYLSERSRYSLVRSQNVFDRYFDDAGLAYITDADAERLRARSKTT